MKVSFEDVHGLTHEHCVMSLEICMGVMTWLECHMFGVIFPLQFLCLGFSLQSRVLLLLLSPLTCDPSVVINSSDFHPLPSSATPCWLHV